MLMICRESIQKYQLLSTPRGLKKDPAGSGQVPSLFGVVQDPTLLTKHQAGSIALLFMLFRSRKINHL